VCPNRYSTSYAISGGANYNPYHCYNFPYWSRASSPDPNNWYNANAYCNSLGIPNFSLLTVENSYDNATADYFMVSWCVWLGAQSGSVPQSYFYYNNGVAAPTPYYSGSTAIYYAPANCVLLWQSGHLGDGLAVHGINIIPSGCGTNCRCATCCQYGN
jgi:hypothetical protein